MHYIFYSMIMVSSFICMQSNHLLMMGVMLLIQTMLISMITGLMTKRFWFSYILFLIFLGGVSVIYLCNPNSFK